MHGQTLFNETPNNLASYPDPSCLTLEQKVLPKVGECVNSMVEVENRLRMRKTVLALKVCSS